MTPTPWWKHWPKTSWQEADWKAWEKAGRPRVPPDMDLPPPSPFEPDQSMGVIPPPGPQPSFGLFAKPRRREANAQSHAIDKLIEKALGPR